MLKLEVIMDKKQYSQLIKKKSDNSPMLLNCLKAFVIGGLICTLGQLLTNAYMNCGLSQIDARTLTSVSLVFIGVLLTAIGVYDDIAKHGGAGTLVPITGFANSIASPAIEFKSEGFITGLGVKMFVISGPVIVYGVSASVIYGIILWIIKLFA